MLKSIACVGCWFVVEMASAANLKIPSAGGPLIIDGRADEAIWKRAVLLPMQSVDFGAPFSGGGDWRAVVRGGDLCLSAHLPEPGRVVARSTGQDPKWWREDLVVWSFHFHSFASYLTITVNPLGGYSVEATGSAMVPKSVLASALIDADSWSAEVAIPIVGIAKVGTVSVERIRVPRPDAPELRWYWPGLNERRGFELAEASSPSPPPSVVTKDWAARERPQPATLNDPFAAEFASVPHQVWTDAERKSVDPEQMWEKNLRSRVTEAAVAERHDWNKVATGPYWERFRAPRLAALKASLGPFPERTPLRAEVTRRLDYGDGFVVENVVFESRPGLVVAANLYLPSKIDGRIPAIVVVHSHHFPKVQSELQDLGMTWARSGTAVLIMDQLGAGERLQSQPWLRESYYSRFALGMQLYLAGDSLIKWMVWDSMRGIDLLLERPYIDPNRIVMLGAVAGGGDPAAVTAALDNRIAAVLPFNFGEAGPEEHYTMGPRPYGFDTADPGWGEWESCRCLRDSIVGQFFPWFICASVAPRPFLFSFELSWPRGVEQEPAWARYKKVFELYGKGNNLDQVDGFGSFPGPGEVENVGENHRKKIYPILNRWLSVPIPAVEYHNVRPDADLMCLTLEAAAKRRPRTVSDLVLPLAEARLSQAHTARTDLAPAQRLERLRTSLKEKLGDVEPNANAPARVLWTKSPSSFAVEAISVDTAPNISVPVLLIKPEGSASAPFPAVLALAQDGKEAFLSRRTPELAALVKHGVAICLADVRGTGETAKVGERHSGSTSLPATEFMLGSTGVGAQLKDARTILQYLLHRRDLDPNRLAVWGDSFAQVNAPGVLLDQSPGQEPGPQVIEEADPLGSFLGLLTALYEDKVHAVAARGGLSSWLSALRNPFCYLPEDVIVPGILETADIADVVAALAPRAVLLGSLVDGRDRLLPDSGMQSDLEAAFAAYRDAPSRLIIRQQVPEPELAVWIARQLSQ